MRYLLIIISLFLYSGVSHANDDQFLFAELTKLAKSGSPEAQYHLGMLYNNGIGTDKDILKAFEWFKKSASSGDPLAHYKLGCYYSGQGKELIKTDKKKALEHKLVAAEAGYVRAQADVADIFYHNKEIDNAMTWLKKSARQGYPQSIYSLFALYYEGKVIPKDITAAYGYALIIERNVRKNKKHQIELKLKELKIDLSLTQLEKEQHFAQKWRSQKTDLTIKAFAGKKESRRIIENSKKMR